MRPRFAAALLSLLPLALPVEAQIPDKFTNLKVLPADIARGDLIGTMRGFATSLGVRCNHCHVGPASGELEGADFASDEKETKRTARLMMQMVRVINGEHLSHIGGEHLSHIGTDREVACFTCHRGASLPSRLEDELFAAWRAGGTDSLVAGYRGLRQQYYGRAIFDFGAQTLAAAAELLGATANGAAGTQAALAALQLETEYFPEYGIGWALLGGVLAQSGDTAKAVAALQRATSLMPGNAQVQRMLQRLQGNRP